MRLLKRPQRGKEAKPELLLRSEMLVRYRQLSSLVAPYLHRYLYGTTFVSFLKASEKFFHFLKMHFALILYLLLRQCHLFF